MLSDCCHQDREQLNPHGIGGALRLSASPLSMKGGMYATQF